jgi:glyceraldehyde 3-phosphate dehydrogenase
VVESTGRFTDREKASAHFAAGAKKVIISAPAKGEDVTIVMGVNDGKYDPAKHHLLSNASCTTNCLVPVVHVLRQNFGWVRGYMLTIHSYTNDQVIVSSVNLVATVEKTVTVAQVNDAFKAAAASGPLKGILEVSDEPLVSVDYIGNPASSTVDLPSTQVVDGVCVQVSAWYDNEWGYSCRCVDLVKLVARSL